MAASAIVILSLLGFVLPLVGLIVGFYYVFKDNGKDASAGAMILIASLAGWIFWIYIL